MRVSHRILVMSRRRLYHNMTVVASRSVVPARLFRSSADASSRGVVDLRSDTLTSPTRAMLEFGIEAPTGDDVFGEDPAVLELESYAANLFGKEKALFVPSGTMGNLISILAHCHGRASEIIVGSSSHICIYEGGGAANLGGVHTRQIPESEVDATLSLDAVRDAYRRDDDDHYAQTTAVCLENTHNVMGGVALPVSYMDEMGRLAKDELNIRFHVDGARIFNSAVSQNVSVERLCRAADSVSVCLSKGLGAPLGSVVVGNTEFIRLAKRARKRCGGGMRQAGVVAAMGLYALHHHVDRLAEDHARATRLGAELGRLGFVQPRNGQIDTNIVYFGLPPHSLVTNKDEFIQRVFDEHNVRFTGGYSKGGRLFRLVAHKDIDDEGIDRTLDALTKVSFGS